LKAFSAWTANLKQSRSSKKGKEDPLAIKPGGGTRGKKSMPWAQIQAKKKVEVAVCTLSMLETVEKHWGARGGGKGRSKADAEGENVLLRMRKEKAGLERVVVTWGGRN